MSQRLLVSLASSILAALALFPTAALAQSSDAQSIADAAKRSREQKKNASKASKVVTDDDIAPKDAKPADQATPAEGPAANEAQPVDASAPAAAAVAPASEPAAKSAEDAELAQLKAELASALKQLDLAQRELALDSDTYQSNPNYQRDTAGRAKVDADKQRIDAKQQEVDRLKTRIAALQELKAREKAAAPAAEQPPLPILRRPLRRSRDSRSFEAQARGAPARCPCPVVRAKLGYAAWKILFVITFASATANATRRKSFSTPAIANTSTSPPTNSSARSASAKL